MHEIKASCRGYSFFPLRSSLDTTDETDCDQGLFKAMLIETICNDKFYGDNVVRSEMLQRCVALKIVVANSPM